MVLSRKQAPQQSSQHPEASNNSSQNSAIGMGAGSTRGMLSLANNAGNAAAALALARKGTRGTIPHQDELEGELGTSLGNLEAYFGASAADACAMVGAEAFCVQNILAFSDSSPAKEVVRHEVMHSLQQGGDQTSMGSNPSALDTTAEGGAEEQQAEAAEQGAEPLQPGGDPTPGNGASQQGEQRAFGKNDKVGKPVLARRPASPSFGYHKGGLSKISPVIKEGYDGSGLVAIKTGWCSGSWRRRWAIYDADDKKVYESVYTVPQSTVYFSKNLISKGKAGGKAKPWTVLHEVTHTLVPFGGGNQKNFPYAMKSFEVHENWDGYMADPNSNLSTDKGAKNPQQDKDKEQDKNTVGDVVKSPATKGIGSVVDYGSVVAMNEGYLRKIYDEGAKGISNSAQKLVTDGVLNQKQAAKWAVKSRNGLKAKVRSQGNPILKKVFETRNLRKYGDKLGPSYKQLYAKYAKQGLTPDQINSKILGRSGKANAGFNRWAGRLKWGGRVLLALDICLAGARVYMAPEGKKIQTALKEAFRIGGAIALGAAGAKGGAALGGAIGALFGGAGAVPGAIIGGIIGGIGGALFGSWLGEKAVDKIYKMFPPDGLEFDGDFQTGIQQGQ